MARSKRIRKDLLTTAALMSALDVTRQTLWRWRKAGCPSSKRGNSVAWDLEAVKKWMHAQSLTGAQGRPPLGTERVKPGEELDEASEEGAQSGGTDLGTVSDARLRRLAREADVAVKRAKAEKEALAVEQLRGKLVSIDDVIREHSEIATRVRDRLLATPGALASQLARESDPRRIEGVLGGHIRHVLEGLDLP